ncbi:MAG: DNA modification methylase [Microbacterium sp.]|uniref:DNA modification methylase n=1 Tax=Microbacterium sp. TaxID=51671 RepID=UPI0039E42DA5
MIAPQSTTVQYSPAEGLDVPDSSGPLQVRNALFVANEDGSEGNLIAAIVNGTDSSEVLNIQVGEGADAITKSIRVSAHTTKSLGMSDIEGVENFEGADPLLINGLDTLPGATVSVYFQSGDGEGTRVDIPVLDGTLAYLAPYAP